ncbi:MAG: AraC family transcriptional regulator [Caldimonas sp.]
MGASGEARGFGGFGAVGAVGAVGSGTPGTPGTRGTAPLATGERPALVFRTVLRGAVQLAWRNRRVRLDEDAWLVLDGQEACSVRADSEHRADVLTVAVSAAERDAAFAVTVGWRAGAADPFAEIRPEPADFAAGMPTTLPAFSPPGESAAALALTFADNLRPRDATTGRLLLAIARSRAAGRARAAECADRVALVQAAIGEELALRRQADRIACVKRATREQLLRRILLAADFIASRHDEPLSLDEMARAASLSRFHFVRLFSLVHGETPHAFLLRKRTAVARRHLAVGTACSEAASRAGFGSRSALFRNLRKTASPVTGPAPCCLSA